jgi:hypothetical protein
MVRKGCICDLERCSKKSIFLLDHKEVKEVVQQDAEKTRIAMQETISDAVDDIITALRPGGSSDLTPEKRRQQIRRWLSPPDPSINHNITRTSHHVSSAAWFFEDTVFHKWKPTSSLLWIYGKRMGPSHSATRHLTILIFVAGSGKSVLWLVVSPLSLLMSTKILE